jgi:hypothetical protein
MRRPRHNPGRWHVVECEDRFTAVRPRAGSADVQTSGPGEIMTGVRYPAILLGALLAAGCSSLADPVGPLPSLMAGDTFLSTGAAVYDLRAEGALRAVDFELTYRNPLTSPVAVPACHTPVRPMLQKLVDGEWVHAFSPVELLCITPPLVIGADSKHTFRYRLRADAYDLERWPRAADGTSDGTYRLHWWVARYDRRAANGLGTPLPLEYVVSNPFQLRTEAAPQPGLRKPRSALVSSVPADHGCGPEVDVRRPVAPLTFLVVAPAEGAARCGEAAGVSGAGVDRGEGQVSHDSRRRVTVRRRTVTQLTRAVVSPAIGGARRRQGAGVTACCGKGDEGQTSGYRYRGVARSGGSIAQLTGVVGAPAVGRTFGRQRAGGGAARRDGGEGVSPRYRNGFAAILCSRIPELAQVVPPPTIRCARCREATGVGVAGRNRGKCQLACHRHRQRAVRRRTVADHTAGVRSPAVAGPGRGDPWRVNASVQNQCGRRPRFPCRARVGLVVRAGEPYFVGSGSAPPCRS